MEKRGALSLLAGLYFMLFGQVATGAFAAAGDVSDDGAVDIADVILSLQIGSRLNAAGQPINLGADVNGDGKIGLEEAVYGLQVASGARTIAPRAAALSAVEDRYAALVRQGSSGLDAATAMSAFMATRPEFASAGVDTEIAAAWGILNDGAVVIVGDNWQFSGLPAVPAGFVSPAALPISQSVSKTAFSFPGAGVPTPPYARLMHSFQLGAPPEDFAQGWDGADALADLKAYLSGKGYAVRSGEESAGVISSLKTVRGDGFFLFNGHGGRGPAANPIGKMFAVSTSTPQNDANDFLYADDLMAQRLIYWVGRMGNYTQDAAGNWQLSTETRYGITSSFVEKYMTFAPDSVVMLMACFSGYQPDDFVNSFIKKNASAVVSSKIELKTGFAYTTYRYFADRLLGANAFQPESPPQRPFPADLVWADMGRKNLLVDTQPNSRGEINHLVLTLKNPALPPILSPSIQNLAVSEKEEKLTLIGFFGSSAAGGKVTVDGWPLTCADWAPGKIVCSLPAPGNPGSKGKVIVELPGGAAPRQSNPRWLTQWDVPIQYTLTNAYGAANWRFDVSGKLRFRADVGNYRVQPGQAPTYPVRGMYATKDSYLTVTASGAETIGDCTETLKGTATFRAWANPSSEKLLTGYLKVDTLTQTGALGFGFGALTSPFSWTATGPDCEGSGEVGAPNYGFAEGYETFPSPLEGIVGPQDPSGAGAAVFWPGIKVIFSAGFNLHNRTYSDSFLGIGDSGGITISWPDAAHQPAGADSLQALTTPR